ncbi:MAG: P-type DNA transfer ATPase VirB11 [Phenylobacterium sp.]|uniref:P-type DNA transfer ATPase VirB11 n=1 Tax=Phenylobacterium sp. TaxID=1871053 RepID=UPI0025D8E3C5|nr:P-type DNA transfer ATPase VirB11 [Phenylobacterium sp.]MCA3730990.1 P-type DNA transfer ATPase VirB11 [Phenylobacterium sp.]
MNANVYLGAFLAPLSPWLGRPEVTDLLVNAPGEVWVETATEGMHREAAPGLDETTLQRLVRQIAAYSSQGVNREQPLLSATLPDGARVQVVAPPATRGGTVLAVRKHLISDLSLEDLSASGLFVRPAGEDAEASSDGILAALLEAGDRLGFLREAVRRRKTIVISGGTGSGKTTLLNALVKEIDEAERLVVIEDAPEIRLDHPNSVGLIAVRGDMGEARVDADALLTAALRLRPDRILLGELRGSEAFAFLRAVNSGHPGSITTIHADSPAGALDQIGLLALTSGLELGWDKVQAYVSRVIDVVVQIERSEGVRRISDIQFLGRRA